MQFFLFFLVTLINWNLPTQALSHASFSTSPLPQDPSALPTFPTNCHRSVTAAAAEHSKEEYRTAKRKLDDILPRGANFMHASDVTGGANPSAGTGMGRARLSLEADNF